MLPTAPSTAPHAIQAELKGGWMQAGQGTRAPAAPGASRHRSGQVTATQNRGSKPHTKLTTLLAAKRWKEGLEGG